MGVPLIGEGWITETEVFYLIKELFSEYEIIHHARPSWLEGQEFDIYIPEANLAIEYMGQQHYEPVDFFGGKDAFEKNKERDKEKQMKAEKEGVRILYIRYDDNLARGVLREKITQPIKRS